MSEDDWDDEQDGPRTVAEIVEEIRENLPWEKQADHYPVVVTTSESRIVWIEAESHEQAVEGLNNDGSWYEHLQGAEPFGHDYSIAAPDEWDWYGKVYSESTLSGPVQQCRLCNEPSHRIGTVSHSGSCPVQVAETSRLMAWNGAAKAASNALRAAQDALSA